MKAEVARLEQQAADETEQEQQLVNGDHEQLPTKTEVEEQEAGPPKVSICFRHRTYHYLTD